MALIRKGKRPKLMKKGTFNLEDLKHLGDIVEVTNFFIDYSTNQNVICVEQNHHGATILDIEYYLKNIARDRLNLARSSELKIHMTDSIENTLDSLKNVLSFNIKIRPNNLELINKELGKHYFDSFNTVSKIYKPEFLKIEAFFKKNGKQNKHKENREATNMFKKALEVFKSNPEETIYYDNFIVLFEDGKGTEETFNLLKNKKVVTKSIEQGKDLSLRDSYDLVTNEFADFVQLL